MSLLQEVLLLLIKEKKNSLALHFFNSLFTFFFFQGLIFTLISNGLVGDEL